MELKIQNITKRYRDKTAVDDVSITLTPGVWGLLGANGAGKTTLMRMLAGILRPSSGRILCDGVEIGTLGAAYREKLDGSMIALILLIIICIISLISADSDNEGSGRRL